MLKRFIFILVLLTIVFFIYRRINPEGAQNLINKANQILGRTGSIVPLTGDMLTGNILTGELLTGTALSGEAITGTILTPTSSVQTGETTGTVPTTTGGLLDTVDTSEITTTGVIQAPTGATANVQMQNLVSQPVTPTPIKTPTKPKTSKDLKDTQNLINGLFK